MIRTLAASALGCLVMLVANVAAQDGVAGQGSAPAVARSRESMWWAPSDEDWRKPCLIAWQRTWDDALALAKSSARPILICVNMDGEPASEHYAGVRYRDPQKAALYAPYVTVVASVYRHTPRDHDEQGQRILCPRFGSVTCGEHIAIEPLLFDAYFEGQRVAPRHIMVEPEKPSAEVYDVYYALDTDTIFRSLREGIANRPPPPRASRTDRDLEQRAISTDVADRMAMEDAYRRGDAIVRRRILETTASHRDLDGTEILRLALFGFDVELARLARRALAESNSPSAVDLIAEVLRLPMDPAEREALVAALVRLGETSPRARTLANVHRSLNAGGGAIDLEAWNRALAQHQPQPREESYAVFARLESTSQAARAQPADPRLRLSQAEAFLELALEGAAQPKFARLMVEDARDAAAEAERLGEVGWRVHAALAVAAAELGEMDEARRRAELAMTDLPADASSASSARVLSIFARMRQRAIGRAVREKRDWPQEWLTDVHHAYGLLARHPFGDDGACVDHYDFLRYLGAKGQAAGVLDAGLARFPASAVLHDRLRTQWLEERGIDGLEAGYLARLAAADVSSHERGFAGYASLVAAEFQRRQGRSDDARAAYRRAVAHFEAARIADPAGIDSSDHFIAMALAGEARLSLEQDDLAGCLSELEACFARRAASAASLDGLNLSPADTARMLRARLAERGDTELSKRLQTAMDSLDPSLLQLPAYERQGPRNAPPAAAPRRNG